MRLTIHHRTLYRYSTSVTRSIQILRLVPRSDHRQKVLQWNLILPAHAPEQLDAYGNSTRLLTIEGRHDEIEIGVEGLVETFENSDLLFDEDHRLPPELFLRDTPLTAADGPLREFAETFRDRVSVSPVVGLEAMMERIRADISYVKGTTHVGTAAAEVFSQRSGVCQDHSHLFIACCRALGVPARYVSGYVYSDPEDHPEAAMHAWAEAWIEDRGWYSYDVSNVRAAGEAHLRLAIGRDYLDAGPVRGIRFGGGNERMEVRVQVMTTQQ